jgi:hypothetical protein
MQINEEDERIKSWNKDIKSIIYEQKLAYRNIYRAAQGGLAKGN